MASSQDGFDAKKMRREACWRYNGQLQIFEAKNTDIWMVIEFITELARVLTRKERQHDFVYIADKLVELLHGNVELTGLMLFTIMSKCYVECEGMLKHYIDFAWNLSNDSVLKINLLIEMGTRYLKIGCFSKTIEIMLKADNIADELKDKSRKFVCAVWLGNAYVGLADYDKATEYYNKGLVISTEIGDRSGIAISSGYLGKVYCALRQYDQAIAYLNKSIRISTELKDQLGIVTWYANLGFAYFSMGQYQKAIGYYDKGLAINSEMRYRLSVATNNGSLGNADSHLEQYEKEIGYFEKSLANSTDTGNQPGILSNNEHFGTDVYLKMEQFEDLQSTTEIGIRSAKMYERCGMAYNLLGKYKEAIDCCNKGLEFSTEVGYRLGIADNNRNLGIAYMKVLQYAKAIQCINQDRVISSKIGDRSRLHFSCQMLGHAYHNMGQYSQAVEHHTEALAISTELGDRSAIASNNCSLGNAYASVEQYEKAIEHLNKALAIYFEIGNSSGRALNYDFLGNVYIQLRQYEKAIAYLNKGLAISSEIGDQLRIASGNANLGNAYLGMNQHEKAIEFYKNSLKIRFELGDPLQIAFGWGDLGDGYQCLGQYEKAIQCLNKSLEISTELGNKTAIIRSSASLGVAYLNVRNLEKAINFFQKSYKLSVEISDLWSAYTALGDLGCSYYLLSGLLMACGAGAMGKLQHAVSLIQKSVQGFDKMFFDLSVDENKISFTAEYVGRYVTLMHCFIMLKRITAALLVIDLSKAKALLAFIQKRKKLDIVDHMACYVHEIWRKIDHSEEDMQIEDFRKAIQLKENNSTILFYSFDEDKILNIWVLNGEGRVRHEIFVLSQDLTLPEDYIYLTLPEDYIFRKLEFFLKVHFVELSRDSSMYKLHSDSSLGAQPLKKAEIRWSQISFNDKFVDAKEKSNVTDLQNSQNMRLQKSHSCNSIFHHNIPNNSELKMGKLVEVVQRYDLAIDVAKLRSPVKQSSVNSSNTTETSAILQALFQALIRPVKKLIKGTKLIIVPDKFLFFAPFCALLDENSCPLSEHYSVQITPSLQTLYSRMKESPDASLGFALFVGNPRVGEVSFCGESFDVSELPNATEEAQLLASRFDAKPLVEGEAIKQRVLECIPGASIIHIAAHGDKKRGEIFLAPNPSSTIPKEESYLLKEKDILKIKINAGLVVLCCCHTGSGQTCSEGVVGLARAFLAAGARSVLATLWRIHDASTKVFMEKFFDEICNETSVCEALRRAMNMLRRHENHFYRDVQIWAPFTIYGEDVKFSRDDIDEIKRKSRDITM